MVHPRPLSGCARGCKGRALQADLGNKGLTPLTHCPLRSQVFGLPSSLGYPLFYKVAPSPDALVQRPALLGWMQQREFWSKPESAQAFEILRQVGAVWCGRCLGGQ